MRNYLRGLPFGVWVGLVIIGLGTWAQDIFGVVIGGVLAVVTLIATDRRDSKLEHQPPPGEEPTVEDRFKDL